ncbi:hypothetical protein ACXR0O_09720 [Verrucomicrobiota bacterium sgz303538]
MRDTQKKGGDWKQKAAHELVEYWITFFYLAVFFCAFITYRRLILAEYKISYVHYGVGLIEALVLAKVILIGDAMHLGRRTEEKPLIYPTLIKTLLFAVWVAIFKLLEHTISEWLHGKGIEAGFDEFEQEGWDTLLAKCVIIFTAFIPFFAFKELGRVLGEGKIRELFFRRRTAADSGLSGGTHSKNAA